MIARRFPDHLTVEGLRVEEEVDPNRAEEGRVVQDPEVVPGGA